jgi:hypothetical protein
VGTREPPPPPPLKTKASNVNINLSAAESIKFKLPLICLGQEEPVASNQLELLLVSRLPPLLLACRSVSFVAWPSAGQLGRRRGRVSPLQQGWRPNCTAARHDECLSIISKSPAMPNMKSGQPLAAAEAAPAPRTGRERPAALGHERTNATNHHRRISWLWLGADDHHRRCRRRWIVQAGPSPDRHHKRQRPDNELANLLFLFTSTNL